MKGIPYASYCYLAALTTIVVSLTDAKVHVVDVATNVIENVVKNAMLKPSFIESDDEAEEEEEEEEETNQKAPVNNDDNDNTYHNEEEEANEFDRGSPGIDFLGVGYDSIFGNTLGSEDSLLDPGYRAPILDFEWRKNAQGYSPSLRSLYPLNGWVRPVYSCGRSSRVEEIKNLDDARNAFSASADLKGEVPNASFSASAKYKKEAANITAKKERMFLHTDMCIRYQAGIPLNIPWKTTLQFRETVETLKPIEANAKNECSIHDLTDTETKKECKELKNWINFFQIFGTHYVHQITLGGKLVQTMKFDYGKLKLLKNSGFDVDLAISAAMGTLDATGFANQKVDTSKIDELGSKTLTVIGGEMPNLPITDQEFATWAKSVADKPMPIGISAECIKKLLKTELHDSYAVALYKYAEINGLNYETLAKLGGNTGGILREIKNGEQVVTVNWDINGARCKANKKILIGFSLLFKYDGSFLGIIPCKRGTNKCEVPGNKNEIRSVSWIVCTTGLQPNITQVTDYTKKKNNKIEVTCPSASVVQFGIKLISKDYKLVKVESCEPGKPSCEGDNKTYKAIAIWIVCVPDMYLVEKINVAGLVTVGDATVSCPKGEQIIAGTKVAFREHKGASESSKRSMAIAQCDSYVDSCHSKCEEQCITTFAMALCSDPNNFTK